MKKILSFIMIAVLATSGLFAVTPVTPTVKSLSSSNTSLGNILLKVYNFLDQDATVILRYGNGVGDDADGILAVNEITDPSWKIGEDIPSGTVSENTTENFTVNFVDGIVRPVGENNSTQTYEISIIPGAFKVTSAITGTVYTAEINTAGDDLIPTATWVDANGASKSTTLSAPSLSIQTTPIDILYHIDTQTVATFKFVWNSVPFDDHMNYEGYYTSTSTVNIKTIG